MRGLSFIQRHLGRIKAKRSPRLSKARPKGSRNPNAKYLYRVRDPSTGKWRYYYSEREFKRHTRRKKAGVQDLRRKERASIPEVREKLGTDAQEILSQLDTDLHRYARKLTGWWKKQGYHLDMYNDVQEARQRARVAVLTSLRIYAHGTEHKPRDYNWRDDETLMRRVWGRVKKEVGTFLRRRAQQTSTHVPFVTEEAEPGIPEELIPVPGQEAESIQEAETRRKRIRRLFGQGLRKIQDRTGRRIIGIVGHEVMRVKNPVEGRVRAVKRVSRELNVSQRHARRLIDKWLREFASTKEAIEMLLLLSPFRKALSGRADAWLDALALAGTGRLLVLAYGG